LSVTIATGTPSASFLYGDTRAGSPTITASSTGPTSASGTQVETITAGPAWGLCFVVSGTTCSSGTQTIGAGGTFTGKVLLVDSFQNPVTAGTSLTVQLTPSGDLDTPNPMSVNISLGQSLSNQVSDTLHSGASNSGTLTGEATGLSAATATTHA
jgi:hypothetical protein